MLQEKLGERGCSEKCLLENDFFTLRSGDENEQDEKALTEFHELVLTIVLLFSSNAVRSHCDH